MQKLEIRQEFDCDLSMLLRAREERYRRLDKFPELKNVEIIAESQEGVMLKQSRRISIADSLPVIITTLLPSGADTLHEESEFDTEQNLHSFTITPGGMGNIFTIKGLSRYMKLDKKRSMRDYALEITSEAFLVGAAVETAIASMYRQTLEKDRTSIIEFIGILSEEDATTVQAPESHELPESPHV